MIYSENWLLDHGGRDSAWWGDLGPSAEPRGQWDEPDPPLREDQGHMHTSFHKPCCGSREGATLTLKASTFEENVHCSGVWQCMQYWHIDSVTGTRQSSSSSNSNNNNHHHHHRRDKIINRSARQGFTCLSPGVNWGQSAVPALSTCRPEHGSGAQTAVVSVSCGLRNPAPACTGCPTGQGEPPTPEKPGLH